MSARVRIVFDRRKTASETASAVIEIVVCLQRERFYFSTGHFVTANQWQEGKVINHERAIILNEEIQKKMTEFEHILIAMQVNRDSMTIAQFKTYLGTEGGANRRNFMAWLRERIEKRTLREAHARDISRCSSRWSDLRSSEHSTM